MTIPAAAQALWTAFSESQGGVDERRFYELFSFGDSPAMADELGALVLAGVKRATAGSVWSYEESGKGVPKPGDLSILIDGQGRPLCIIETLQVDITPFHAVTAEFAATEGEGDGSLAYWRREHRSYFQREREGTSHVFSEDMLLACERFRVVHRA